PLFSLFSILNCSPLPPPSDLYPLSLHDALPIYARPVLRGLRRSEPTVALGPVRFPRRALGGRAPVTAAATVRSDSGALTHRQILDRKSTRLNSSHVSISYAVFCLKKKKKKKVT